MFLRHIEKKRKQFQNLEILNGKGCVYVFDSSRTEELTPSFSYCVSVCEVENRSLSCKEGGSWLSLYLRLLHVALILSPCYFLLFCFFPAFFSHPSNTHILISHFELHLRHLSQALCWLMEDAGEQDPHGYCPLDLT